MRPYPSAAPVATPSKRQRMPRMSGLAVEGRHEMHLGGARVGEAHRDVRGGEGGDEGLSAVHGPYAYADGAAGGRGRRAGRASQRGRRSCGPFTATSASRCPPSAGERRRTTPLGGATGLADGRDRDSRAGRPGHPPARRRVRLHRRAPPAAEPSRWTSTARPGGNGWSFRYRRTWTWSRGRAIAAAAGIATF